MKNVKKRRTSLRVKRTFSSRDTVSKSRLIKRESSKESTCQKSKNHLETFFSYCKIKTNNVNECYAFFSKAGKILHISPEIERITGQKPNVYISNQTTFRNLFLKRDSIKAKKYFIRARRGETFRNIEFRAVNSSGCIVYLLISVAPVYNNFKNFIGFHSEIKNITVKRKAEEEQRFFNSLTHQVSDSIIVTDVDFRIIFVNKAAEKLYGYSKNEMIGRYPDFLNAETTASKIERDIYRTVSSGKTWDGQHLNKRKDGSTFMAEFRISPIKNTKGEVYCYSSIQRDVSDKEEVKCLIESQRDLGIFLSSTHNLKSALEYILETAIKIKEVDCGGIYLVDEATKSLDLIVHKGLGESFVKSVSHFDSTTPEWNLVFKGKSVFTRYPEKLKKSKRSKVSEGLKELMVVPVFYEKQIVAVLNLGSHQYKKISIKSKSSMEAIASRIGAVISRLKIEAEFRRNAYHDSLTSIANRRLFLVNVEKSIKRAKRNHNYRFAVLFLDLDRFKNINDGLGHLTGDRVILEVSRKLQHCIRANDTLARFGGDEFTVLLDDIDGLDDAIDAANRTQLILSKPLKIDGREFYMTGSIGVLMYSPKYQTPEDMIRDADTALYKAKLSGRARYVVFDEQMHTTAVRHIQLENDLQAALKNKEFYLNYQPMVSLKNGLITGVEALLRWNHPEKGMISPLEFIPLAEETGAIIPITEWIFEEVTRQTREWCDMGFPVHFAINLSALHLAQTNLPKIIEEGLSENSLDPDYLELEITETAAMKEFDLALTTLHRLRSIGGHISIDDFGVGYAPFVYLKKFPISKIKIDISFIRDISKNLNVMAIIEAMIAMAHILRIKVIAEGVETPEQLMFLRQQKCDEIQGFLFSRPVSSERITQYFLEKKRLF